MQVFGLDAVEITIIICIIGIGLRVYIGKVKNPEIPLSINAIILSFMIGVLISIGLVAPVIDAIPQSADKIVILTAIVVQIIVVMKSESISTAARDLFKQKEKEGAKIAQE